ncbi:MAG TPA: 2-oxoacid:acceptor oxidoreductase family protein [Acidimicrobiia bacterium]|nr:2-oxoacid:acceptor oxidoreductase family protein [Acidimicrobiia bacterium]
MERELLLTGIGGQGIQLAANVVARAALAEGREVQLFGSYGGMMRGGNTEATLVVADGAVQAPPTVGSAWSAIVMHHDYSEPTLARLRSDSVVMVNSTVFERGLDRDAYLVVDVPATDLAVGLGNIMAASMVMVGAFSAVTGFSGIDALVDAVPAALPPYRARHVALNQDALRAGFGAAPDVRVAAWSADTAPVA